MRDRELVLLLLTALFASQIKQLMCYEAVPVGAQSVLLA